MEAVHQGGRRGRRDGKWARAPGRGAGAAASVLSPGGALCCTHATPPRPGVCAGRLAFVFPQDKTLKCSVYRVRGSISAANYIQLPKTSTQSLGLTGRYLYVLFRPLPTKHFVIHLDVATEVLSWGAGRPAEALPFSCRRALSQVCCVPTGQPGHPTVIFQSLQGG